MSPYIAVDALAYYRYENFRFGLNVENVFDTEYYESSLNRFRVYPLHGQHVRRAPRHDDGVPPPQSAI